MHINLIGCGVSGLTTALVLQEEGHTVCIYAEKMPQATTSAVAAAIWFPFSVQPREKANQWSYESFLVFQEMVRHEPSAGVSMIDFLVVVENEADAWWQPAFAPGTIRPARPEEMPLQAGLGFMTHVPLVESPVYLDYLLQRFWEQGGKIVEEKVKHPASLLRKSDFVVNCAGLGARELVGDTGMYAIRGQVVKVAPRPQTRALVVEFTIGPVPGDIAYILPRRDCIVLGGTAYRLDENMIADPVQTQSILERCADLVPEVSHLPVIESVVGLRPGRDCIRLEKELNLNLIHNYGHGGGGYTVSWGCAREVARLVAQS
ncbi:MAG: amino acid oxidase [Saprospiraceae bacterium]|nr:MAG: amino acid oxidase [Saprospiraceae bacterium]